MWFGDVRRLAACVVMAGLVTAAAACSGGDDDAADPADDPASGSESGSAAGDPYDGHASETYDGTANWLCHPELGDDEDECRDLSATEVLPDGTTRPADLAVAEDPAIDCFYVYPTVSQDSDVNSDLEPGDEERLTVGAQAAPFASTCRVFAPVYRQVTLAGLGTTDEAARATAYDDVVDAWKTYISQHNEGRGVVLIGHSQGTGVLRRLIAEEIDTVPELRERLVSAILMGSSVFAPDGADVGGSFTEVPACREREQIGCVITFSSYSTTSPPPATGFFGGRDEAGNRSLCTDPVTLAGGNLLADTILPREAPLIGGGTETLAPEITTRYIVLPGTLRAACERTEEFDYFAVRRAEPADVRPIEAIIANRLNPDWGLHLQDANLALGDLLEIVTAQSTAFVAQDSQDTQD